MTQCKKIVANALLMFACCVLSAQNVVDWKVAEIPHAIRKEGEPKTVTTPLGNAVAFSGSDAFFVDVNPLKGLTQFTLEAIFKPDGDGEFEQRFLHLGTMAERVLFEIRVNRDSTWYFDTFIALPEGRRGLVMIDQNLTHPTDRWYHAALVIDGTTAKAYINGKLEFDRPFEFVPFGEGITSIGVRQNLVSWFKGSIYRIRITPKTLTADDFLNDQYELNK